MRVYLRRYAQELLHAHADAMPCVKTPYLKLKGEFIMLTTRLTVDCSEWKDIQYLGGTPTPAGPKISEMQMQIASTSEDHLLESCFYAFLHVYNHRLKGLTSLPSKSSCSAVVVKMSQALARHADTTSRPLSSHRETAGIFHMHCDFHEPKRRRPDVLKPS